MSLITRCPACGTMFKVVPDQLRISEGWVRCGHCSEVFDASAHMQKGEDASASSQAPSAVPAIRTATASAGAARSEPRDAGPSSLSSQPFGSSLTTEIEGVPSEAPDSRQLREEAAGLFEGPLDRPFTLQFVESACEAEAVAARAADPELHDLSFVRQARRKAFWTTGPMRSLLIVLLVVLTALLAGQFALQERDRLAAQEPALRPWLAALCQPLHCAVRPPRQIDALSIDSSAFNKLRPDTYRLSVTVKNQATTEVATPSLEVTLTDAQDQPVVRRVLQPAEMQPPRPSIAAGGDWSGTVALAVVTPSLAARVAGYRVLAFYP